MTPDLAATDAELIGMIARTLDELNALDREYARAMQQIPNPVNQRDEE